MRLDFLRATHPTYDAGLWRRYDALYRGGEVFAGLVEEFLPRNPSEPSDVYNARKLEAAYFNYGGPICDWFAAKLLAAPFTPRAKLDGEVVDPDPFYAEFREDCDGAGTDLVDFARERFCSALVKGRSWWCAELPSDGGVPPVNRAEYEARGLGRAYIYPIENEQVLDWETDRRGELLWAVVHDVEAARESIGVRRGARVRETWRVYDRANVEAYVYEYDPTEPPPKPEEVNVVSVGSRPHGFRSVPLVPMGFVGTRGVRVQIGRRATTLSAAKLEGFWLMNRLASPQIAHFRRAAALDWNLTRTCYAMPVFSLRDREPPVMGSGYYIMLSDGESASWMAPPTEHLAAMQGRVETLKDEIYRVANQMAQGVNNNAAAVGRSGESKAADAANAEVCLHVYGAVVREAIERTYDLLADGRNDPEDWSVEGLNTFSLADAALVVDNATKAAMLPIPSSTFRRELAIRTAEALLPGADQEIKDTIRREIADGIESEEAARVEDLLADGEQVAGGGKPGAPKLKAAEADEDEAPESAPGASE